VASRAGLICLGEEKGEELESNYRSYIVAG